MKRFLINFSANAAAIYLAAQVFHIISISTFDTGIIAVFVMTLVNMILRPIIMVLALPVNLITFGLFILIINTWMVMLTGKLVHGLYIPSFWTAFGLAIFISLVSMMISHIVKKNTGV